MSDDVEVRAVLITRTGGSWHTEGTLRSAFDAAGDQSRIRWCVEHDCPFSACVSVTRRFPNADIIPGVAPCRIVDAIVVPLSEEAA